MHTLKINVQIIFHFLFEKKKYKFNYYSDDGTERLKRENLHK